MWDTQQVQYLSGTPRDSSPQAPVRSFPIIHLFSPPFEVEIHGCKIYLILIVRGEPSRKVRLHRPTIQGYGRPWRKDEELDTVFLARTLKLPVAFTPSSTSWPALERSAFRSSSRNTLARLAVALEWREE